MKIIAENHSVSEISNMAWTMTEIIIQDMKTFIYLSISSLENRYAFEKYNHTITAHRICTNKENIHLNIHVENKSHEIHHLSIYILFI